MGVLVKQIKVEKGNKVTDWTPAPEDVDSSISAIDSKITTTNNKVSSIETNLSSITSRVSNVENTTATINGNVTNLQTRMNTAEQKITATAITSTITEQINNDHILVNTSSTKLDKYGFHFIKNNQKLSSLKNGGLYSYNSNNGKFLGSMQPILPTSNTYSSFGFLASGNCDMFQIAYAPSWVNDTENIAGAGLTSVFNINFVDKSSAGITKGAYLYTNLNLTGYLAMNGNNIIGANAIGASEFQCNKFYSTNGGKPILMEYLGSELKIYPTAKINLMEVFSMFGRSATYFNQLKQIIEMENYDSKEDMERILNKYATGSRPRITQEEYDQLFDLLYPPVYDIPTTIPEV